MFGWKLWYSGWNGSTKCDRCGRDVRYVASPGLLSFQSWCAECLLETGRHR